MHNRNDGLEKDGERQRDGGEGERERARRGVLTSELHFYRLRRERRIEERKKEGGREGGEAGLQTIT